MKIKYLGLFILFLIFFSAPVARAEFLSLKPDSLIKGQTSTIYYYAADGYRYVFPNEKAFDSWFSDFGNVITISNEELGKIPLKGNVTYRPGVRMVKIQSVPKVYAVDKGGKLRWIKTEELAKKLYGDDWNKKIDDIPDAFFVNYQEGNPIEIETDYNATLVAEDVKTINKDRGIVESVLAPKSTTKVGDLAIPTSPVPLVRPDSLATSTLPLTPFISNTSTPFALPTSTTSTPAIPALPAMPAIPAIPATPAQPISSVTSTPFVLPTSTTSTPAVPAVPAIPATPAVPAQPISSATGTPPITPPSTTSITGRLVVLTPNGGDQWITGSTYTIQWTNPLVGGFSGDKNMALSINVYRPGDGVWDIANAVIPTTQTSYQWTIPSSMPTASNYYARVCLVKMWLYADLPFLEPTAILPNHISMPSGACVGDESDGTFSILAQVTSPATTVTPAEPVTSNTSTTTLAPVVTPTLTVTSPNGGENWKAGENHAITWTSSGLPTGNNLAIELVWGFSREQLVATQLSNTVTSYNWSVPFNIVTANHYKMRIIYVKSDGSYGADDYSDNEFTITYTSPLANTGACTLGGKSYLVNKPGVNTISSLQAACSSADYKTLLQNACNASSNFSGQEGVLTRDANGNDYSSSCGQFGCGYRECSQLATYDNTVTAGACFLLTGGIGANTITYQDPDTGTNYAKKNIDGSNSLTTIRNNCTKAIYDELLTTLCASYPSASGMQESVMTFDVKGSLVTSGCAGASSCVSRSCPPTPTTSATSTAYKLNNLKMLVWGLAVVFLASATLIVWRLKTKRV